MPSRPIDLLLVEDNPADARLLVESLKDAPPYVFTVTHVPRLRDAVDALARAPFNVIALDLTLPDSTGLETVARVQAAAPGVPIVVLTGLQDEALALEAVRQGVQDYLVKGQCESGLAARALRYAVERRRAEAALHESEERFRALSDATSDPVVLHEDGRVVEVNQAFVRTFGYSAEEVVGRNAMALIATPDSLRAMEQHVRSGSEAPYEAVLRRKDGSTLVAEIRGRLATYKGRPVRVASAHDVTQRKEAEEAVRRSERKLRTVLEHLPVGVWFTDESGRIVFGNAAGERVWGGARYVGIDQFHEYKGWWADTGEPLGPEDWGLARALRTGREALGEMIDIECFDGTRKTILNSAVPLRDEAGKVLGGVVINEDVTDRRRAEEALRESEARSKLAQRAGGVGIFDWDLVTGRSVWSAEQEEIYGLPPGRFAGTHQDWLERVHPEDRGAAEEQLSRWLGERRRDSQMEYRIVRPDGQVRWLNNRGVATYDAAGRPLRIVGTTIDITDRRRVEQALRDQEARLRAIVDNAVDAIITIDDRGLIDTVNPATERLFGYARDEMAGRNVSMLMPEPFRSDHDEYLRRYLGTGEARIIGLGREVVGLRRDGTTFPLDLSVSEFHVAGRRMFTGILHDVTNRRRLEREILEASANEQRRVGHELHDGLCQQLTGMAFSAEILARKLEVHAPDVVPLVRRLADEVDQAITQTRALARGLNPVEIHADSLAPALEDLARKVTETFGVSCRFRTECIDTGGGDNTAATHLYRIAQEAISNAVRHGGAKKIELKLRADDRSLSLSITDDGKGFAAGERAAAPHEGKRGGIGLQTMSYRAKLINGILDVRPGRGRGVVVTCSVPRAGLPRPLP